MNRLYGPSGNILGNPARDVRHVRWFDGGPEEPPPDPEPPTVAKRPWIGSSAPEGLAGFNNLQTNIVGRALESRTIFSSSFVQNPTSLLLTDIQAGRVPSYSNKPPSNPTMWDEWADHIAALPGHVIATVSHEPENDPGYSAAQFEDDFSEMYSRCSHVPNLWMGPVYMRVTGVSQDPARIAYRNLLNTMSFDMIMCDGYNQLYKMSFAQLFNWVALAARARTDLNTDPTITGVPWGIREFSVHGTDVQRANWVNSARTYWEKPENSDLKIVNWFDSEEGDNAAIVGWRMRKALPVGWYPQVIPERHPSKLYARAAPPHDPEWVEDLLTPAAIRSALSTPRRVLGTAEIPPIPPPEPPDYGALPLGETNYPIPPGSPPNVVFCSPGGSDTASGSSTNPLKTLQAAVNACATDGYVIMRGGDYPESVQGKWGTPMTIQAYPGEAPVLIGSNIVTGWIQDNTGPGGTPRWRKNNWTVEHDATPHTTAVIDPSFPESVQPEQVWIDDVALQQVNSLADVDATAPNEAGAPGTFWQDKAANVLWIGSTPFNKTVRVAVRQVAFNGAQNGTASPRVDLKGIGVTHYATSQLQFGAVKVYAPDTEFEHCHITHNSSSGVFFNNAEGCKVVNCTIERNGQLGMRGFTSRYFDMHHCRVYKNNRKYFQTSQAAGGVKFDSYSHGFKASYNEVLENHGHGLWVDIGSHYSKFWRNDIRGHTVQAGLFIENCNSSIIFGNYIRGNLNGIRHSESGNAVVWNNTFVDNTYHWKIQYGTHEALPLAERFAQVNFNAGNNVFAQYIADNAVRFVHHQDLHGGTHDIDEMNITIDYSAAYRLTPGTSKYADVLLSSHVQTTYATQDNFQTGTGREVNGIWVDTGSDPYLEADKSTPKPAGALIETGNVAPVVVSTDLDWTIEQTATPNRGWQ